MTAMPGAGGPWRGYISFCAPSGGKAFGLLKAQQEERLDEINKVKGGTKGQGLELGLGEGPGQRAYPGSGFSHSNSWMTPNTTVMRICSPNWKLSRVRGKL